MSTPVELRLPAVGIDVSDLTVVRGATSDIGTRHSAAERGAHGRPASLLGVRPSSVEITVRLGADVLALALTIALVRPAAAPAVLWAAVVLASLAAVGLYAHRLRLSALDDVPSVLIGSAVGLAAMSLADAAELRQGVLAAVVGASLVVLGRMVGYTFLRRWRSNGLLRRNAVLVGGGSRASDLVMRIADHPETGLYVRGVLGSHPRRLPCSSSVGDVADLPDLVASGAVDTVIVGDASSKEERRVIEALRHCPGRSTEIFVLPRLPELSTLSDDEVWGVPLQRLKQHRSRTRMVVKRVVDVTIATVSLIAVSWLIGLAALAVRLELGPGVIYRQERVGLNGRRFQLLKLRSMRSLSAGSSSEWAPSVERTGRVGAFIRRYSIDELPQLVNVIRGDMSLVGPRPERPEFVDKFGDEFPSYAHRHRVMVGLTGLAAVEGLRGDTSIADRAYFDNWYIEHWSLWLDVKIMVRTASSLVTGTGG
jgi:exopolysaccharide biosynthesis polyprenyl glycosylphosphotransferase